MSDPDSFQNSAKFTGSGHSLDCDYCDEPLMFAMKDNYHEFSIGLLTVLQCLKLAEQEGYIPPLPDGWWLGVIRQYKLR